MSHIYPTSNVWEGENAVPYLDIKLMVMIHCSFIVSLHLKIGCLEDDFPLRMAFFSGAYEVGPYQL